MTFIYTEICGNINYTGARGNIFAQFLYNCGFLFFSMINTCADNFFFFWFSLNSLNHALQSHLLADNFSFQFAFLLCSCNFLQWWTFWIFVDLLHCICLTNKNNLAFWWSGKSSGRGKGQLWLPFDLPHSLKVLILDYLR